MAYTVIPASELASQKLKPVEKKTAIPSANPFVDAIKGLLSGDTEFGVPYPKKEDSRAVALLIHRGALKAGTSVVVTENTSKSGFVATVRLSTPDEAKAQAERRDLAKARAQKARADEKVAEAAKKATAEAAAETDIPEQETDESAA